MTNKAAYKFESKLTYCYKEKVEDIETGPVEAVK